MTRIALIGLLLTVGCASARTAPPASLTAMQHMQLREQAGLYPPDWSVKGDSHAAAYDLLKQWAEDEDVVVTTAALDSRLLMGSLQEGAGGWIILINRDLSPNEKFYTLAHELGHLLGPNKLGDAESEVFAELVAATVCQRAGLDIWPQATSYLARRVVDRDLQMATVQRYGAQIDAVANRLAAVLKAKP